MPIYEYKCQACDHRFEKLVRNCGDLPATCPACGQPRLKKQFSTFSAMAASAVGERCPAGGPCSESGCRAGGKCPF